MLIRFIKTIGISITPCFHRNTHSSITTSKLVISTWAYNNNTMIKNVMHISSFWHLLIPIENIDNCFDNLHKLSNSSEPSAQSLVPSHSDSCGIQAVLSAQADSSSPQPMTKKTTTKHSYRTITS